MQVVQATTEDLEDVSSLYEKNGYVRDQTLYHYKLDPEAK
jgi:hypothetical protein